MLEQMSESEQEQLAGAIVCRLEGRKISEVKEEISETDNDENTSDDSEKILERLLIKWLESADGGGEKSAATVETTDEKTDGSRESAESFLRLKMGEDESGDGEKQGYGLYGRNAAKPAFRSQMEQISNFFMRDSRRYDAGFERF
jgi:hypothetical protein